MSNNNGSDVASGGCGFVGLLTLVFIVLKLLNVIKWSWVWVLSPIWILILLVVVLIIVFTVIAVINGE